jgi:hypothetical protein
MYKNKMYKNNIYNIYMSYVSTNATLNIGDANSSTVNMNTSSTLNLGGSSNVNITSSFGNVNITGTGGNVNITSGSGARGVSINGVPLILSSATGNFASITGLDYNLYSANYYLLPYTTTQNFLIQWGYALDPNSNVSTVITFPIAFAAVPYVFAQQYAGTSLSSASNNNIVVVNVTETDVSINSAYSNQDKYPISWIAFGIYNI